MRQVRNFGYSKVSHLLKLTIKKFCFQQKFFEIYLKTNYQHFCVYYTQIAVHG